MTSRRVNVTLTFVTDLAEPTVLCEVTALLADGDAPLVATATHAYDPDDDNDTDEPTVHAVINPRLGQLSCVLADDPIEADRLARDINGIVVELPAIADHRQRGAGQ